MPAEPMPCENVLYHYCSVDAFTKIVENKSLWLTSLFFLNDNLEHVWLRTMAVDMLERERAKEISIGKKNAYKQLVDIIDPKNKHYADYCCAFSSRSDSLSQWRGYGDDGHGIAIGFDKDALAYDDAVNLWEVIYDFDKQGEIVNEFVEHTLHGEDLSKPLSEEVIARFQRRLLQEAARCKHRSFLDEGEWRVIYSPDEDHSLEMHKKECADVRHRVRGRQLIPYYNWPLKDDPSLIRCVMLGPKNQREEHELAVENYLEKCGFPDTLIFRSSCSYC